MIISDKNNSYSYFISKYDHLILSSMTMASISAEVCLVCKDAMDRYVQTFISQLYN